MALTTISRADRELLELLAASGGEALRQGHYFEVGPARPFAAVECIKRLEKKRLVIIEYFGESAFARMTPNGFAAIEKEASK